MTSAMPLPDAALPKGQRYMRALRRAVVAYWYATLESKEAAHIEAASAATVVNVLDESVFQEALGQPYQDRRARDRLGQVVTGLELVRNCEVHASVDAPDLLVESRLIGVPSSTAGQHMRGVYKWAEETDLPDAYKSLSNEVSERVRRARGEAQHGYRQAVQGRVVTETLLDAIQWFQGIDPSLIVGEPFEPRYAFGEVPEKDPADDAEGRTVSAFIAPLAGLDFREVFLPDIATRWYERRAASSGAIDDWFEHAVTRARKESPFGPRTLERVIRDDDGKLVGYGGSTQTDWGASTWVERAAQLRKDVDAGADYVVASDDGTEVTVTASGHKSVVAMEGDRDLMLLLPDGEPPIDWDRLRMVEEYPDAYLDMRVKGF